MDTHRSTTFGATAAAVTAVLIAVYALGQSGAHPSPAYAPVASSSTPAAVSSDGKMPSITVAGLGKISGAPDMLSLSIGVETHAPDVNTAMNGASKAMRAVIAALRKAGVSDADLQTAGVSVQGNYVYENKSAPRLVGYVATQQLTAKLRSVAKAGATISAAVAAGGNAVRLNGVSLSLDDDSALLVTARDRAFQQAKAKAQQYAQLAGVTLGAVVSIDDSVVGGNQPYYGRQAIQFASAAGASFDAAPIQGGSQEVAVSVSVVYAIG